MALGRRRLLYLAGCLLMIAVYAVATWAWWSGRTWTENGPLSIRNPQQPVLSPLEPPNVVLTDICKLKRPTRENVVREAVIDREPYYACYDLNKDGSVWTVAVYDGDGNEVKNSGLLKRAGVWRWAGLVKTVGDIRAGGLALAGLLAFWFLYYRVARPGPRKGAKQNESGAAQAALAAMPVIGWLLLARQKGVSRQRKIRAVYIAAIAWTTFAFVTNLGTPMDALSLFVALWLFAALVLGAVGGRLLVAPAEWGYPDGTTPAARRSTPRPALPSPTVSDQPASRSDSAAFSLERPGTLPTFTDVGGMDDLKAELRETVGVALAFPGEAHAYRLTWNGILLHGRPGVGKTFIARATAGEFGLNFIAVAASDLVSAYRGESGRNVAEAFSYAARNVPSLLFFDEFDSIAQNREDWPDQEARRTVNQLLQALVEYRVVREQIVMAATNDLDGIDPAVIRPGRFDRLIRVDVPDQRGRIAVFRACLQGRPVGHDLHIEELARRSAGLTPAAIARTVERAAMTALKRTASSGELQPIHQEDLLASLAAGGQDRPQVEGWTWDDLVLPADVISELKELETLIEDPELAHSLGIEPPTGALLTGPPGTGKTTIARVLAAQAKCSFYPVTAADVTSMWLGESERSIQRLFDRARENRPSIIFIDEIDAIAARRGQAGAYDRQINELLAQLDGLTGHQGVFVLAATNRADQLDPALLRGGRLSRTIEIPLPHQEQRLQLLRLFTKPMPLGSVDLENLAAQTRGASGADLHALCQQAALHALVRLHSSSKRAAKQVTMADFQEALEDRSESLKAVTG